MARFQGIVQGQRGKASRLGSKKSGIEGIIRGWNVGVTVWGYVDEHGKDHFIVFRTGGTNERTEKTVIAEFSE